MRPSSSPSDDASPPFDSAAPPSGAASGPFDPASDPSASSVVAAASSDAAVTSASATAFPWRLGPEWWRAMLEVEAALVLAQARVGLVPPRQAERIAHACRTLRPDPDTFGSAAAEAGTPVVPLVRALREALPPEAAAHVHQGATSQDIVDTAAMLLVDAAFTDITASLEHAAEAAAALAAEHRDTPMLGRTLLQQAAPTTFGVLVAGWLCAVDRTHDRLTHVAEHGLAVQLGGPVGTLEGFGEAAEELTAAFAAELGLPEPVLPWHTDRTRIAEIAGVLGQVAGVAGKVGRDVALLAQDEVGEVREAWRQGRGVSSSLPHKRNPVAAVSMQAAAVQAPGLVAALLAAMPQELQRAAGAWQAEWAPLAQLVTIARSSAAWLAECLGGLEVDVDRMRHHLELAREESRTGEETAGAAAQRLVDRALQAHRKRRT